MVASVHTDTEEPKTLYFFLIFLHDGNHRKTLSLERSIGGIVTFFEEQTREICD